MVFKDFDFPNAPGLVPRNLNESLIVSHQEHRLGILSMNREDEPVCLLQVEYNLERAKKKPFTKGDVLLLKVVTSILTERLYKFAILED